MLNPTVAVSNLGVDTNVFNQADQASPKRDFTLTLTPQTDLWLRVGRSWLTGTIREDLVWYRTYASERAANDSAMVRWMLPLNRLSFNVEGAYASRRDRPGFEIDARSQRTETSQRGGIEVRATDKTHLGVRADRRTTQFERAAVFGGINLRNALNRTETNEAVTVRHQLTPLTGLTLEVVRSQDRFDFSPERDADSTSVVGGVKLDPFALIKGSGTLGYRLFEPRSSAVPAYKGLIASGDLSYVAFLRTRLGVQITRDVQYSFQLDYPFYVLTGVSVSVVQQLFGQVEAVGRIGRQQLAYRNRNDAAVVGDRFDRVRTYGASIGYRVGSEGRIRFNVDQQHRSSPFIDREYHGLRFGTSVTYGL